MKIAPFFSSALIVGMILATGAVSADESKEPASASEECKTPLHISTVDSDDLLKALYHIEKCVGKDTKLDVYVSGLGGSMVEAQAFYDQMRTRGLSKVVRFKSYGLIASASNIIWMAADERVVTPGSMFVLHGMTINIGEEDPELGIMLKNTHVQNSMNSIRRVVGENAAKMWSQHVSGTVAATAFDGKEAIKNGWATSLEDYK